MKKFWNIWKRGGLINIILCRKFNWIGHILRIKCIVQDGIGGQMTEMKGRKKKNTGPRCCEKQNIILGAKGGSRRLK